jgi:hypothetical protein
MKTTDNDARLVDAHLIQGAAGSAKTSLPKGYEL